MRLYAITLLAALAIAAAACAGTVQVSTTLGGEPTHLWLQSGADPWVWQLHTIHLPPGETRLTFPFAAGDVDLDTVHLELAAPQAGVTIGTRLQDPGVPRNITWLVSAEKDADARLRLGYVLKGIEWRIDYAANLNPDALTCDLQADFTITNHSKKEFRSVAIRLPDGQRLTTPLDLGQSTQFPLLRMKALPFTLSYIYDVPRYGDGVAAIFAHERKVGEQRADKPTIPGHVRIFGPGAGGAQSLIGEDNIPYCPPMEKLEFKIAGVPEVSVAKRRVSGTQVNQKQDVLKKLVMFDLDEEFEFAVRNNRRSDVTLVLRDNIAGAWEILKSSAAYTKVAGDQIEFSVALHPGDEAKVGYTVRHRNQQP